MRPSSLEIAKPDIIKVIEKVGVQVFTRSMLDQILLEYRDSWRLSQKTTLPAFIQFLSKEGGLKSVKLDFPNRAEHRFTMGNISIYSILMSLRGSPYFSHYTAMNFHGLTEQMPKAIYVNAEQQARSQKKELTQSGIDMAFKRTGRISNNVTLYDGWKIYSLSGMNTGRLGVIETGGPNGEVIDVTNIERTLIDIIVRPYYSGGTYEILRAFKIAREKDLVSVNKLAAMLRKLDFVYPYHQAIGFLMERSGVYDNASLDLLRKFEIKYDFYLMYNMKEIEYSKDWRLFYPKGF